ncbi:MAG TPA: gamma-glutamyl-gamma-aminobutyrate hydrolase family protein [Pseudohaliea sp.]|nr:gamma-glutamyl-gamma-aminobutyrate hydrolase family protein [Pseudohaliea sp.]
MKLGILRTDTVRPEWAATYGEYPDMFEHLLGDLDPGLAFATWHVEAGEFPGSVDAADAWLITGSKASVYEDQPWIHRLLAFIRELHAARKPLVGICFGHQAVALALGGEVRKSAKGWGVGLHRHRLSGEPSWFDGGDRTFRVLVSHQDQVERPAPGTEVLAGSEFCENAVCQVGDHILTFQGHPEFVPGYAREIMDFRREIIGEDTYQAGMASLAEAPERERLARWILAFLAGATGGGAKAHEAVAGGAGR